MALHNRQRAVFKETGDLPDDIPNTVANFLTRTAPRFVEEHVGGFVKGTIEGLIQEHVRRRRESEAIRRRTDLTPVQRQEELFKVAGITGDVSPKAIERDLPLAMGLTAPIARAGALQPGLTTKILRQLEGKNVVSRQFVEDLTRQPGVRQAERDLIQKKLGEIKGAKIVTEELVNKVKSELLPLKSKPVADPIYEKTTLRPEIRGQILKYEERVYESPVTTSVGGIHFSADEFPGYFAHVRVEDIVTTVEKVKGVPYVVDFKTRRIIEVQADLFQRGRLEKVLHFDLPRIPGDIRARIVPESLKDSQILDLMRARGIKVPKDALIPYRNIWHEPIIKKEVKRAAADAKSKLQFPTGETAMKIEGLGDTKEAWAITKGSNRVVPEVSDLKKGLSITNDRTRQEWIITDVLGEGGFKAIPKQIIDRYEPYSSGARTLKDVSKKKTQALVDNILKSYKEAFDIKGKATIGGKIANAENIKRIIADLTEKIRGALGGGDGTLAGALEVERNKATTFRFYEVDIPKFLKNNYGIQRITDPQGVTWWEMNVPKEAAKLPIEAFGLLPFLRIPEPIEEETTAESAAQLAR